MGRRIEKAVTENSVTTTTRYLYDNEDIIAEYDGNGNLITKYIHGLGIDEPLAMEKNSSTYYYHADGLGSVVALTDGSGTVVQKYEYDSFGNITSTQNPSFVQPYTFTGREYDSESGLLYLRERTLDTKTGTFIQKDPIGFNGGDMNLYRYVRNRPINYIDSFGLAEHHPIPRAVWRDLPLQKTTKDFLEKTVIDAGKHGFGEAHYKYNELIKDLWSEHFKGTKPQNITKEMVDDFLENVVKKNAVARKLTGEILKKGGSLCVPAWVKTGMKGLKYGGIAITIIMELADPADAHAPTR